MACPVYTDITHIFINIFIEQNQNMVIYFICSLFNDTVCNSDYIASNDQVIMNNKLRKMCKGDVVA
jgi:hypothetical protein